MKLKLDADQIKAVEHFEGPALVVAGPGSGKTTVIKERILNLIQKHNVDPEHILAIAFTNAAADEMKKRISLEDNKPKICTLHVFGKDLISDRYDQLGFSKEPVTWDGKKMGQIINTEKDLLDRETRTADVAIYKIEGMRTSRRYIGQTTDPERREWEHRTHSSNRGLREALEKGDEQFDFDVIECVKGSIAYPREKYWIDCYRNRSVVNLVHGMEKVARQSSNVLVTIYKITSITDVTAYIGYTTDPESIRKIIENEGIKRFTFEVIRTDVPWAEVSTHVANEIKKHKNWAVFNREDPEKARYSHQLRIEVFCQYFDVPYDEVLAHPEKFENLMERFDDLKEDIEKSKQQVNTGLFEPDKISDPVLRAFAKRYEERKKAANAIDFLDMLIYSAHLLETDPDLHQYYRDKHRYVFVDEFQDISPIDFRLIDLFSQNLFAVGDDDQAIYGFRGGDSSIMQEKFGKRENVSHYEITRNYRSTSTIVRHAKAVIEHNSARIPKNLRANNSVQSQVEVLGASKGTVKEVLLRELFNLLTTDFQKVGILARNWHGEINEIQGILKSSELDTQGFEIDWEKLDDPGENSDDLYEKSKRIMFLRRGTQEIEILNIHTAKGREWDKVILLVNTMYNSLPDRRNDLTEERRLFYVAVTRAKQELTVLNSGICQFISEFQNVPPIEIVESEQTPLTPKSQKQLENVSETLLPTIGNRIHIAKKQSEEASKVEQVAMIPESQEQIETAIKGIGKQHNSQFTHSQIDAIAGKSPVMQSPTLEYLTKTQTIISKDQNIWTTDRLHRVVEIYLDRLMFAFKDNYKLNNINQNIVKQKMVKYLLELEDEAIQEINSFASKNVAEVIRLKRYVDYCAEQEKIHLCTNVFRNFWERMWEIIEQSRNPSESHTKVAAAPVSFKIKQVQPSVDPPVPSHTKFTDGEIVKGIVVDVNRDEVVIDIGFKSEGYIPTSEFDAGQDDLPTVQVGDEIDVYIVRREDSEGQIVLSKKIADQTLIWDEIATAYETGTPVMGRIIERIKGGLRVSVGSLRGFLPASQVELHPIQNLEQYVEQTFEMKVISLSKRRHNIVLSRRAWLEAELVQKRSEVLNTLEVGQQVTGVVKNITAYGAFVDLGGVDGLLHKTDMAWKRIHHPSDVVSVGEEIEVQVIGVNQENEKISLGLKQKTPDPWADIEEKYQVGATVRGVVVNIVNYGAFIQIEEGVVGLIHVSEMPLVLNNILPLDLLNKDDELEVTILEISKDSKRISLGIKPDRQNLFEEKKVEVPSDEPPSIVEIDSEISNKLAEPTVYRPTQKVEEKTLLPEESPIVAEVGNSHSDESIDSMTSKPLEEMVDSPPPMSREFSEILDSQIHGLKPEEIPETETVSEPLEAGNNNARKTLQEHHKILNTHIQNLKPEISEIETTGDITKTPPLETEVDGDIPVGRTVLTRSDSSTITDSDAHQIKDQNFQENEIEDGKKSFGYYLHRGGRFAVEKIKTMIFRKPSS